MKKTYEAPIVEIVEFEAADVITASGTVATDRPATDVIPG